MLDSAGYGPVTVSQAVSIIAPAGVYAGISVFAGAGVTVNAGAGVVTLRGLTINSLGGNIGVDYVSGARLYLDRVIVTGFALTAASVGVRANLSAAGILNIREAALRDNAIGLTGSASSGTLTVDVGTNRLRAQHHRSRAQGWHGRRGPGLDVHRQHGGHRR